VGQRFSLHLTGHGQPVWPIKCKVFSRGNTAIQLHALPSRLIPKNVVMFWSTDIALRANRRVRVETKTQGSQKLADLYPVIMSLYLHVVTNSFYTPQVGVVVFFKTSVNICQTVRRRITEYIIFHGRCHRNPKPRTVLCVCQYSSMLLVPLVS
jgi:hypothetical protein